jgi:hypothetical protein
LKIARCAEAVPDHERWEKQSLSILNLRTTITRINWYT